MKFETIPFKDLLSEIIDNRGKTCPTVDEGIPLIATNCVNNNTLYPTYERIRYVSKEAYENWFRGHPEPGDILFVTKGSPGRCNFVPDPVEFCIAQDMVSIRADENKIDNKFLFALLRSPQVQHQIGNMHVGSLIPHFKKGDFDKLFLEVPSDRDIQKKIGEQYFKFSQKIHLNQQTNETLEAMAQAIFKSWFVDFDPVRAKMEAKVAERDPNRAAMAAIAGVSSFAKSSEDKSLENDWDEIETALEQKLNRMSDDQRTQLQKTAELFPDELVESEIGVVPKGWEVKPFYDTIDIIGGGTPKTKIDEYWDGDILWYSVVDAPNESDLFVINTEKKITKTGLENSSAKLVDAGTTIISARGTVGKLALTPKPMTYNQSCYGLRSKIDCPYFNFYKTKQLVESLKRGSHGSVFDTITQKTFKTIEIAQPSENLEQRFDEALDGLMSMIKKNSEENKTLSQLRDTLLPKLISGDMELT
ncbi:MAG: restriction endonuclease subunit S [Balneolaceae bacterium]|nr:restriction endonuclease subunit S [Balneolaceae bacterium]MCH8550139.1 restriction endonuclease subunit S [Balneolaceae bacterium]